MFFFLSHLASNNSRKTMSGLFAVKHSCEAPFFASDHVIKKKKKKAYRHRQKYPGDMGIHLQD